MQGSEQFGLFIWLLWQHTRPQSLLFQFLHDPIIIIQLLWSNYFELKQSANFILFKSKLKQFI